MRVAGRSRAIARAASVVGWFGSSYGIVATLVQAYSILMHELALPASTRELLPGIRFALVGILLYGAAFFLVTVRRRLLLTLLVLFIIVPLNALAMLSVGPLLLPATVLLLISAGLFWIAKATTGD